MSYPAAGAFGTALCVLMRMELQERGLQIFGNPGGYNIIVSAHGW